MTAWLPIWVGLVLAAGAAAAPLPWDREEPLRQAARRELIRDRLEAEKPDPGFLVNNPEIQAALWGPAGRITLSLLKNDVFDRRYAQPPAWPTLAEVRAGADAPANLGFDDMPPGRRRPVRGYLRPEGGRAEPDGAWNAYPFPCQKPVGQIVLGLDELTGAESPAVTQRCSDGLLHIAVKRGSAAASIDAILAMNRNVYALRGTLQGIASPWLRVYRHLDQSYRMYLAPDGHSFLTVYPNASRAEPATGVRPYDYARDAAWNGAIEAPTSGSDGRDFWIRQRLPAEKTFPAGFEYVLMGRVEAGPAVPKIATAVGQTGLGTPARGGTEARGQERQYGWIRQAPGAAATASAPGANRFTAYFVVVTSSDAADPLGEAKRQLAAVAARGFDALIRENEAWFGRLYDRREEGRVYYAGAGTAASEDLPAIFRSWHTRHGGAGLTDARRHQASADYAEVEQDAQPWKSLPCYNELFYTPWAARNRGDSLDMWWQLLEAWLPAARRNARETYGMPGMMLVHGYLPPVKPDTYVHTNVAMEYCLETAAQVVKVPWDQWDYGGDVNFLRDKVYPALRDLAIFYAAYAKTGEDGKEHIVPALEAEAWGIFPGFRRGQDTTAALCMFRWTLGRAAEASELLGVDADRRGQWRAVAAKLAPYPIYRTPRGPVFNTVGGTVPSWKHGDHPWFGAVYPTTLADEINLDSSPQLRAEMVRTARWRRRGATATFWSCSGPAPRRSHRSRRVRNGRSPRSRCCATR